jgi:hypothetical protein
MRYPKRRANLLYKLRRKGIEADTKQRVIFIPYGEEPRQYVQAVRLSPPQSGRTITLPSLNTGYANLLRASASV